MTYFPAFKQLQVSKKIPTNSYSSCLKEAMDLQSWLPPSPLLFTIITALVVSLAVYSCWVKERKQKKNLPPGPKGWPIVGNLFQLKQPAFRTLHRLAQKHGPIMSLKLGCVNTVVISSSEKAKELFKSSLDLDFASRPQFTFGKLVLYNGRDMFFGPYGKEWRDNRKLCVLQLLNTKCVESFARVRKEEVDVMLQRIWNDSNGGTSDVNISEALGVFTSDVMWRIVCGRKFADNHEVGSGFTFKRLIQECSELAGEFNLGDFLPFLDWMDLQGLKRRMRHAHNFYDDFADNLIAERLNANNLVSQNNEERVKDFLDILLENELDMIQTKALLFDMASAGTESSANTMEWAMSLLLKHPEILLKAGEEIDRAVGREKRVEEKDLDKLKYLQCVLKESMRLYPGAPLAIPHFSTKDTKMFGYDVPKGSMLFINIWAIGRDEAVWDHPNDFRPERFMNEDIVDLSGQSDTKSIPFSAGRRGCPGIAMAIRMMLLVLASLIHGFEWRVDGKQIDMTEAIGITIPRKFPLIACPYMLRQISP